MVQVFDSGEHDGIPYLVMELLPGRTLADEVGLGPLDPEVVRRIGVEVLGALAELRQTVAALRQSGELGEEGAAKVLAAAAAVEAQLGSGSTPTAQVTTTLGQRDTRGTTRTTKNEGKGKGNDKDD